MMQFGEIIEPSSRAVWDQESDEETESVELTWSKEISVPQEIKNFIIFEGKIAVDFAESCVVSENPAAILTGANVHVYHLPGGLVVCTCQGHNVEGLGGKITVLLQPWISKAGKVIAVQTSARTAYLGDSEEPFLLRGLHTSSVNKQNRHGTVLEQPNMLTGLTAGVISYCEHIGLPGSAWCLYTSRSPYGTDSTSTKPIDELLHKLQIPLSKAFNYKPPVSSNIYM